jgi:hypothetical protein
MISSVKAWVGNCARGTILDHEGMTMNKIDGERVWRTGGIFGVYGVQMVHRGN